MNGNCLANWIAIFLILQAGAPEKTVAPTSEAIVRQAAQAISSQYWDSVEEIRANAR